MQMTQLSLVWPKFLHNSSSAAVSVKEIRPNEYFILIKFYRNPWFSTAVFFFQPEKINSVTDPSYEKRKFVAITPLTAQKFRFSFRLSTFIWTDQCRTNLVLTSLLAVFLPKLTTLKLINLSWIINGEREHQNWTNLSEKVTLTDCLPYGNICVVERDSILMCLNPSKAACNKNQSVSSQYSSQWAMLAGSWVFSKLFQQQREIGAEFELSSLLLAELCSGIPTPA